MFNIISIAVGITLSYYIKQPTKLQSIIIPIKCIVLIPQLTICFSSGGATSVVTATTTNASARQILEEL